MSKAYSKTWSYREDALLEVYKQMSELSPGGDKEDARARLRASVFLINKAIKDKVLAVGVIFVTIVMCLDLCILKPLYSCIYRRVHNC